MNAAYQYGLQVLRYVFPFVLVPYLTRVLTPDGYAIYAYVLSFMTIIQVFADFGFTLSGTKAIAATAGDKNEANKVVGSILMARGMVTTILLFAVLTIGIQIPILADNYVYMVLAFFGIVSKSFLPDFVFQGYETMGPLTTRYFLTKGISVVLTLVLVHSVDDLYTIQYLEILSGVIATIWSYQVIYKRFGLFPVAVGLKRSFADLRTSAIYCISNVSSSLFSGFATLLIGVALTHQADISYWALAMLTVQAVQALYAPIVNSLYPHMLNSGDFVFAKKLCLLALPALVAGTALYIALAEWIMLILGGEEYLEGAYVLVWISPLLPISFYGMLLGWPVLGAIGYERKLTAATVGSSVFGIAAMLSSTVMFPDSIEAICVARVITEAVMLLSRASLVCYAKYREII